MNESLMRTFISVSLPREIVNIKKMLQSTINSKGAEIKWVRDGNMHLTLKFIGHAPETSVDDINNTLKSVTEEFSTISLSLVGSGCFPRPERARTLWVGIAGELDNLDDFVDASGYAAIAGEIAFKRNNIKSTTLGVSNAKKEKNTNNK